MYIDTHTHIYLKQFDEDRAEMIQRAINLGVDKMFMPNIDSTTVSSMLDCAKKFPEHCFSQIGLHPCSVKENYKAELDTLYKYFDQIKSYAVGEIGTDLYWDQSFAKEQDDAFRIQIKWSKGLKLPIVIHSREALDINIKTISEMQDGSLTGVFHCFNGDINQAKQIQDLGFYIGLGGVITYKNSGMAEVVSTIDLNRVILETDAPYLSPVPFRGKRNEPAYVVNIAEKISNLKQIELSQVAKITTENALKLYQFDSI